MLNDLKQTLIDKISSTEDNNLIQRLNANFDYFSQQNSKDILDDLSPEDYEELDKLLKEPFGHETITHKEFMKATDKWRTK